MIKQWSVYIFICLGMSFGVLNAQNAHGNAPENHGNQPSHETASGKQEAHATENHGESAKKFDLNELILNHIGNTNEFHLWGDLSIPLPCILYSNEDGLNTFLSSEWHHGHKAYNRYVSDHGAVRRIKDASFPSGSVALQGHGEHFIEHQQANGEEVGSITYNGKKYQLEKPAGLLTTSSFYDFSITKNVFTMLLAALLLFLIFRYVANRYKSHPNQAPTGIQNVMEVLVMFIVNEVAKPMLGDRYLKFLPYLLTIFFFILTCNVLGLIPIFPGGANVTGNIATTAALALIAFIVVNVNGKADYWKHIFWMPGVPVLMKIFLAPIELIGVFTKPFSLMIRLFANITAGHIIILALVGLIFVFGQAGQSIGGSIGGAAISVPFTLFLSIIELLVAFLQAFIFTILTASYIGAATEEHHH
jgi:F-type H+-transporting ATPase subunit a